MLNLSQVTLVGIECVDVRRLSLALNISCRDISFGAVKLLTSLKTDDVRKVEIPALNSIEAYSNFCLQNLNEYIDTPYALVVQHDGFVLNAAAWKDEFLEYDYIGAPIHLGDWAKDRHDIPEEAIGSLLVGNGGFSLRSKRLMRLTAQMSADNLFAQNEPEDWAVCYIERARLESCGIKFAPVDLAEVFSFEGRTKDYFKYKNSFGFHSLQWTDISSWLADNPEYVNDIKNEVRINEL
jgi:hypothetical protein